MRNKNIAFLNLSTGNAFIAPSKKKRIRKNNVSRKKPFIIINTDNNYGPYMKEIVKLAKQLGLLQQEKIFRQKSVKSIRYGEFLVFGDAPLVVDFDYRVETDKKVFASFDARKWKVYDVVKEFSKIVNRLQEFAKANNPVECSYKRPTNVRVSMTVKRSSSIPTTICSCPLVDANLTSDIDGIDTYTFDKLVGKTNIVDYAPVDDFIIEDVNIHYRWVKIGYRQFTIKYDNSMRRYINVNGTRYYIRKNRYGKEYLTK